MFHKALCQNVFAHKVHSQKALLQKVFLLILCGIFGLFAHPGWSQTLAHAELPEADTLPLVVVPPSLAQVYQPAATPQLLAFSPDHKTLAFSTNHNTKRQSALGDIWASELHLLALKPQAVAETIINAKTTASFAHYGAPAIRLTWQDDKILFVISDGDDDATQLTYLTQQQRLENPNIGEYTLDETPSLTALEASIQQCFADWPAEVVENGMAIWVEEGNRALYQANHVDYSRDIWLIDVPNCQRRLIPVPTHDRGQPFEQRLAGAVLNQAQLVLVLDSRRHPTHPGQTLVLQTSLDTLGTPEQRWDNWSYGLGSSLHFELLATAQNQKLFLLTDTRKPCRAQLYSLSPHQLRSFMVDAHRLCNGVVDHNGQLGLTLYAYPDNAFPDNRKANELKVANRIWVVNPAFLAHSAN